MKKNIARRRLLAGTATSALLAALPLSGKVGQTNPIRKVNRPNKIATAIRAANLPNQRFSHMVYSRLGYGITPGVFNQSHWNQLGANDTERLSNFVAQQLAGGADDPVDNRIAQAGNYATLDKSLALMWNHHHVNPGSGLRSSTRPRYEMQRLKFLRATYTLFPLQERIADFWHNHFSLNGSSLNRPFSNGNNCSKTIRNCTG